MEYKTLATTLVDGVLTVTFTRPEKLNAYNARMGREITHVFNQADADDAVRVIVVTGQGRVFCAGVDMAPETEEGQTSEQAVLGGDGDTTEGSSFIHAIYNCRKPSIAAINGAAVGVGLTLTLPMDIRLTSEGAKMGFVFARRGLTPEAASSWFLPRIVGLSQSLLWCLTGRMFLADEALAKGLVSSVVPADQLLASATEIAREIATQTAPVSIALTRQLLWRFCATESPFETLAVDGELIRQRYSSADLAEGMKAFFERRTPQFTDRVSSDMPPLYPWWTDK